MLFFGTAFFAIDLDMKILAIEKENVGLTSNDFKPFLEAEARHVWELNQKGIIREIYFTDEHNAILILECENLQEAETLVEDFPLVKNGLITFDLMALNPYTGFSRLFKD